jgi:hypothetical protein
MLDVRPPDWLDRGAGILGGIEARRATASPEAGISSLCTGAVFGGEFEGTS